MMYCMTLQAGKERNQPLPPIFIFCVLCLSLVLLLFVKSKTIFKAFVHSKKNNNLKWMSKMRPYIDFFFVFYQWMTCPGSPCTKTKESSQVPGVLPIYIFITFLKQLVFHHILCIAKSGSIVNKWSGIHMNHIGAHECKPWSIPTVPQITLIIQVLKENIACGFAL